MYINVSSKTERSYLKGWPDYLDKDNNTVAIHFLKNLAWDLSAVCKMKTFGLNTRFQENKFWTKSLFLYLSNLLNENQSIYFSPCSKTKHWQLIWRYKSVQMHLFCLKGSRVHHIQLAPSSWDHVYIPCGHYISQCQGKGLHGTEYPEINFSIMYSLVNQENQFRFCVF